MKSTHLSSPLVAFLCSSDAGYITGGTGKLTGLQGMIRTVNTADPKPGINEGQTEIEYLIGK